MPFDATARLPSAAVAAGSAGPQSRSGKLDDSAGVCRMLFDAPQRDQLCRVVAEQLRSEQIARSKTWNYDFAKELPAEGRYEWVGTTERVHHGTERPAVSCCKRQTKLTGGSAGVCPAWRSASAEALGALRSFASFPREVDRPC